MKKGKIYVLYMKIIIYTKRLFRENRIRFPKNYKESEKTASSIFLRLLKLKETELYSNIKTFESYLRSEKSDIYIFLEKNNMKVINSIYGYDIELSDQMVEYLTDRFQLEMSKRRQIFKEKAISRIQFSLDKTLKRIEADKI